MKRESNVGGRYVSEDQEVLQFKNGAWGVDQQLMRLFAACSVVSLVGADPGETASLSFKSHVSEIVAYEQSLDLLKWREVTPESIATDTRGFTIASFPAFSNSIFYRARLVENYVEHTHNPSGLPVSVPDLKTRLYNVTDLLQRAEDYNQLHTGGYNHDAAVEIFDDQIHVAWNTNSGNEGHPPQRNVIKSAPLTNPGALEKALDRSMDHPDITDTPVFRDANSFVEWQPALIRSGDRSNEHLILTYSVTPQDRGNGPKPPSGNWYEAMHTVVGIRPKGGKFVYGRINFDGSNNISLDYNVGTTSTDGSTLYNFRGQKFCVFVTNNFHENRDGTFSVGCILLRTEADPTGVSAFPASSIFSRTCERYGMFLTYNSVTDSWSASTPIRTNEEATDNWEWGRFSTSRTDAVDYCRYPFVPTSVAGGSDTLEPGAQLQTVVGNDAKYRCADFSGVETVVSRGCGVPISSNRSIWINNDTFSDYSVGSSFSSDRYNLALNTVRHRDHITMGAVMAPSIDNNTPGDSGGGTRRLFYPDIKVHGHTGYIAYSQDPAFGQFTDGTDSNANRAIRLAVVDLSDYMSVQPLLMPRANRRFNGKESAKVTLNTLEIEGWGSAGYELATEQADVEFSFSVQNDTRQYVASIGDFFDHVLIYIEGGELKASANRRTSYRDERSEDWQPQVSTEYVIATIADPVTYNKVTLEIRQSGLNINGVAIPVHVRPVMYFGRGIIGDYQDKTTALDHDDNKLFVDLSSIKQTAAGEVRRENVLYHYRFEQDAQPALFPGPVINRGKASGRCESVEEGTGVITQVADGIQFAADPADKALIRLPRAINTAIFGESGDPYEPVCLALRVKLLASSDDASNPNGLVGSAHGDIVSWIQEPANLDDITAPQIAISWRARAGQDAAIKVVGIGTNELLPGSVAIDEEITLIVYFDDTKQLVMGWIAEDGTRNLNVKSGAMGLRNGVTSALAAPITIGDRPIDNASDRQRFGDWLLSGVVADIRRGSETRDQHIDRMVSTLSAQ